MATQRTNRHAGGSHGTTRHPLASADRNWMAQLRAATEANKGKLRGVAARGPFDSIIARTAAPKDLSFREATVGGIPGWWVEPGSFDPGAAILHLHGGWFNWGTAKAYRHLVGHIAAASGSRSFVPDYRLAPEHPFPAAVDDARASYQGLASLGVDRVAITGDSAGGNLALSLLLALKAQETGTRGRPVACVALSPVTDLTLSGRSWATRANADPYFVRDQAQALVETYLAGHDAADPLASPLNGEFAGLPPIRVHVGDDEVLLDDSVNFVTRAVAAGVDAEIDIWEGMPHGFVGGIGAVEAAGKALERIGAFLQERLHARGGV
jgi:epsilon-lactone hydrolase